MRTKQNAKQMLTTVTKRDKMHWSKRPLTVPCLNIFTLSSLFVVISSLISLEGGEELSIRPFEALHTLNL